MMVDRDICVGCGACVNLCPQLAIRFIDDRSYIDRLSCIECGTCQALCGVDAIFPECRFPEVIVLNVASNPYEEDLQDMKVGAEV
jgi:Fe-S-cluster-containing hydrogenase component 2